MQDAQKDKHLFKVELHLEKYIFAYKWNIKLRRILKKIQKK